VVNECKNFFFKINKTSLTIPDLSLLLQSHPSILKSVNLMYLSFNFFQFHSSIMIFFFQRFRPVVFANFAKLKIIER
jgi:hypothetical protein